MSKTFIKGLLATLVVLLLPSCTVYTEKQSEALSRTVYATKDSIDAARIDLADVYIKEAARIVKPPKTKIEVRPVIKKTIDVLASDSKHNVRPVTSKRAVIVPNQYKNDTVVVIGTEEYERLLKDKEIFAQIEKDNARLTETKTLVDQELIRQAEYNDKMVKDLNMMQKKLVEKDLAILQRNIVIISLVVAIAGGIYLRMKGIL